ncbi:MAG TPA: STAS/SEC14 domain-containing protein [Mucilaginibacter sp.]|nr:STAS/SEC14 domain-containing protein [Mucilaginibacter sp.]
MIQLLHQLPDNVVGVELTGEVTKNEYDNIFPEVEDLLKREDEINYLVVIKTPLSELTLGVWWDDFKLALKHYTKWNRVAIVTDEKGISTAANIVDLGYPGETKTFQLSEFEKAVAWAAGITVTAD